MKSALRTIFINRFFYPDHSATSQMLSDLAFGLTERGMPVTVITSRLRYTTDGECLASQETISGVEVKRVWTTNFGRAHLAFRSLDYLTFYLAATWALFRVLTRGDVVVAMTDPPMLPVVAAPIAKLRRAKLINWLQDLFPEVAEALGIGGKFCRFLFKPLRWLRDVSLKLADMNVAIGEIMSDRLIQRGIAPEHVHVLPNWADCNALVSVDNAINRLHADWRLSGQFVVGYSGNLGRAHDIETLVRAIAKLEARGASITAPPVRWLFIGGGHLFEDMKREAASRDLKSVTFQPYQPRNRLSESLSAADVHIVALRPELEGLIVPSKFYGVAAAGRAAIFIGAPDGEIPRSIARGACGATVASGDSDALVETVISLANDPKRCREMGKRARTLCVELYSKTNAIDAWNELLHEVIQSHEIRDVSQSKLTWT